MPNYTKWALQNSVKPKAIATLALLISLPANTTLANSADAHAIDTFLLCSAKSESTARLACFDTAAKNILDLRAPSSLPVPPAPAKPSQPIVDAPITNEKPAVVISPPSTPSPEAAAIQNPVSKDAARSKPETQAKPKEMAKDIPIAILKVEEFDYGKKRLYLSNGQVWQQTTGRNLRIPKQRKGSPPNTVTFQSSFGGGSMLRVNEKGSAVRVKRIR